MCSSQLAIGFYNFIVINDETFLSLKYFENFFFLSGHNFEKKRILETDAKYKLKNKLRNKNRIQIKKINK